MAGADVILLNMVNNKINLSDYANLNYFPKLLMKLKCGESFS
jgi:hypothetical protein